MTENPEAPDNRAIDERTAYKARERVLSSEAKSLSAWALIGAIGFVLLVVILAFGAWTSSGTNPAPAGPSGGGQIVGRPPTQHSN
ncbi:hypothetical protein [Rhizobium sp. Root1220]|uniref:hypothetical protein n=1 Tax=Rhizobium sp. Root1220 TaxID=1736432 RepID=UPI0006FDBA71|nr:hypothetical protein [Rhizobium sp. Root1220]KQV83820.1 hypothetical protein ASC90_19345 [Rhizobium sp. Root1220]